MARAIEAARRERRESAPRALGWIAALAVIVFAVVVTAGHFDAPGPDTTAPATFARDTTAAFGHHHGTDVAVVHGLRSQPASRSRASVFAVLPVGVVVAALTRRALLSGVRVSARSFRRSGLRPGRGPPLPRVA
jgi:hypothetical protein